MNSKFLKLALCLGLFAGVMNNTSFSMEEAEEGEDIFEDNKLVSGDEAFEETKKVIGNLYENNIEVDLFRNNYNKMTDEENDMSLSRLNALIQETRDVLKTEDDPKNIQQMVSVLKFNNEFLPKAKTFYHDVVDSYDKINKMFDQKNQKTNNCKVKFNELTDSINALDAQVTKLSEQIKDLQEKREYIKNGYLECLQAIKKFQQERGETAGNYQQGRFELSQLTEKLRFKVEKIMQTYSSLVQKEGSNLKQYRDNESTIGYKKNTKKNKNDSMSQFMQSINLNNKSKMNTINEELIELNNNTNNNEKKSIFVSYLNLNKDGKEEKKERKPEDTKNNEKEFTINEGNNNNNRNNENYNEDLKDI